MSQYKSIKKNAKSENFKTTTHNQSHKRPKSTILIKKIKIKEHQTHTQTERNIKNATKWRPTARTHVRFSTKGRARFAKNGRRVALQARCRPMGALQVSWASAGALQALQRAAEELVGSQRPPSWRAVSVNVAHDTPPTTPPSRHSHTLLIYGFVFFCFGSMVVCLCVEVLFSCVRWVFIFIYLFF